MTTMSSHAQVKNYIYSEEQISLTQGIRHALPKVNPGSTLPETLSANEPFILCHCLSCILSQLQEQRNVIELREKHDRIKHFQIKIIITVFIKLKIFSNNFIFEKIYEYIFIIMAFA